MTTSLLLAELELDIEWRSNELIALFRDLTDDDNAKMRALRRATIPMLQSHAEGFVKFALQSYLRHINSLNISGATVRDIHLVWALHREFGNFISGSTDNGFKKLDIGALASTKSHYSRSSFINQLDKFQSSPINLDETRLDRLEQNLDQSYLSALLYQCGIDPVPHQSYSQKMNGMVQRRNSVAHGENENANISELKNWNNMVNILFREVRDSVFKAAINREYLKLPQVSSI